MAIRSSTRLLLFSLLTAGGSLLTGCSDPSAVTIQRLREIGAKGIVKRDGKPGRNEPTVVVLEDTTISADLLQQTLRLSNLESIALRRVQVTALPGEFQYSVPDKLDHVELTGLSESALVRSLAALLTNASMIQLDGISLQPAVLSSLAANSQIEHLGLCDMQIPPEAIDRIHPPRLKTLDLSQTDFGDESARWLATFPSLIQLRVSKTRLTRLPHDGFLHELTELHLDGVKISEKLADDIVSLPKLVSLSLRHCRIDSAAVERLASRDSLGVLTLQDAQISEPDLFHLATKLRMGILNVSGTPFSDRCLDALIATSGSSLNLLGIVDTSLTMSAHDRLPAFSKLWTLIVDSSLLSEATTDSLKGRPHPVQIESASKGRHGWPRLHHVVAPSPL